MKVSKVEFGNDTVMDITDSTVTENNLLSGEIAYGSDGERVVGTVTVPADLDDLSDVTITSPTDGQALVYNNGDWVNGDVATTDEKVKQTLYSGSNSWRRILIAYSANNNEETQSVYKSANLMFNDYSIGTTTEAGRSILRVGNTTNSGIAGNQYGELQITGKNNRAICLVTDDLTATRTQTLQDKDGTIALTSDIQALDGVITGSAGSGKTLTAFSQSDGVVTATFGNISIAESQVTNLTTDLGNKVNTSDVIDIEHGGTGATTRLNAVKALTNENVTTPTYVYGMTNSWAKAGYTSIANLKTTLGLGSAAYTESTAYAVANKQLTNEDLDTVTDTGFYYAAGGNTCSNKPTGVNNFGLEVIRDAGGSYYTQIIYKVDSTTTITSYRRYCKNGTWSSWVEDKFTDTTYTFATGDSNGQIKVTPNGGSAQNVPVKGLGTAAYTASTDYGVNRTLTDEDLNTVKTTGFYIGKSGNTCTNKPSGVAQFGLIVTKTASSNNNYWKQILFQPDGTIQQRTDNNNVWSDWTEVKTTDTNTTYTFAEGSTNGKFTVTPSGGSAQSVTVHGLGSAAYTASTAYATSDHVHGNITNDGKVSSDVTIANGDKLLITDSSDSNKVVTSSITFNGSTTTQCLTRKGTWANFSNNSGTVTSVTINATSPIAVDDSTAITGSGTRTISHAISGATAGSYGDSSAQTPSYGGTFKVPYITVNDTGHVTGISAHTVKIPASDNTDTKVTQTNIDDTSWHTLVFSKSNNTDTETDTLEKSRGLSCVNTPLGTTTSNGVSYLAIGTNIASGTANNYKGRLRLYDTNTYRTDFYTDTLTADRAIMTPNKVGTLETINGSISSAVLAIANSNLLRLPYATGSGTSNGITRTINADGSITVTGTATANTNIYVIAKEHHMILPPGTYFCSGCPMSGSTTTYFLQIIKSNSVTDPDGSTTNVARDVGSGTTFTLSEETNIAIYFRVNSGYAIPSGINLTVQPFLKRTSDWIGEHDVPGKDDPVTPASFIICPKTSSEIKIVASSQVSSTTGYIVLPLYVSVSDITATSSSGSTAQRFRSGYYQSGTYGGEISILLWKNGDNIEGAVEYFKINGADATTKTIKSYYK